MSSNLFDNSYYNITLWIFILIHCLDTNQIIQNCAFPPVKLFFNFVQVIYNAPLADRHCFNHFLGPKANRKLICCCERLWPTLPNSTVWGFYDLLHVIDLYILHPKVDRRYNNIQVTDKWKLTDNFPIYKKYVFSRLSYWNMIVTPRS